MKKTRFGLRPMLLLPLFVVAALLLLFLRGPREGVGKVDESRQTANTAPVQDRSSELKPNTDDQGPPRSDQLLEMQELASEKALQDRPAGSDTTATDSAPPRVDESETNAAEPYVGAASFRCVVPDGGAMLTGGWALPNGGQSFALISPRQLPESDGRAVSVSSLLFELPAEQLTGPEWNTLLGSPAGGVNFRGASLDADEIMAFRENYLAHATRVMSSPSVSLAAGQYASIQVSGSSDGVMLGVVAEPAGDGSGIELGVSVAEHRGLAARDDE